MTVPGRYDGPRQQGQDYRAREVGAEKHQLRAAGEYAAAKALGVPWDRTVNTFKLPDLGANLQVRTRPNPAKGDLQVRPGDKDDEIFVQVVRCAECEFRVHGWLYGRDAKPRTAFTRPDRTQPVYYAPIYALDTIQALHDLLHGTVTQGVYAASSIPALS